MARFLAPENLDDDWPGQPLVDLQQGFTVRQVLEIELGNRAERRRVCKRQLAFRGVDTTDRKIRQARYFNCAPSLLLGWRELFRVDLEDFAKRP